VKNLLNQFGRFSSFVQAAESARMTEDRELYAAIARANAAQLKERMLDPSPSGLLGNGRLGTLADAAAAGLLSGSGVYIGLLDGVPLHYSGAANLLCYGPPRSGKMTDILAVNAGMIRDRTLITVDVKSGELAYASRHIRAEMNGEEPLYFNPFGLMGLPHTSVNAFHTIFQAVAQGRDGMAAARDVARVFIPETSGDESGKWVKSGARKLIATRALYSTMFTPDDANLGDLWRFLNCSETELQMHLCEMAACAHPGIAGRASWLLGNLLAAPKQFQAYWSEAADAVEVFEPESELERATRRHELDLHALRQRPRSLFIILPTDKIDDAGVYVSLMMNVLIEGLAKERGPVKVLILCDEMPQLKPIPAFIRANRLLTATGLQIFGFAQSRSSLEHTWGKHIARELESTAGVFQVLATNEPPLIRDLELLSGITSVVVRSENQGGGEVESAGAGFAEHRRPVLQPEDIVGLRADQQILRVSGCPHLIVADRIPYYRLEPVNRRIRDVRPYHSGLADDV
jgi:type IV secretion system protein VirD4